MRFDGGTTSACADETPAERRPLFDIDPGWLFILAGLALCVAGVLIPAHRDLHELRSKLHALRESERLSQERLRLHARFLADLEDPDEALVRRLAAVQLNLVPAGDVPVVLASSEDLGLTAWIDARAISMIENENASPSPWPDSMLSRLANGPRRLWLLGGGVLAVFAGLMLGPSRVMARQSDDESPAPCAAEPLDATDEAIVPLRTAVHCDGAEEGEEWSEHDEVEDDHHAPVVICAADWPAPPSTAQTEHDFPPADDGESLSSASRAPSMAAPAEAQLAPATLFDLIATQQEHSEEPPAETLDSVERCETPDATQDADDDDLVCEIVAAGRYARSADESDLGPART